MDNGTFWAGIVFDNLEAPAYADTEQIPPFIRYKIRYDIDKVDSTIRVQVNGVEFCAILCVLRPDYHVTWLQIDNVSKTFIKTTRGMKKIKTDF